MTTIDQYKCYRAIFRPTTTDDLKSGDTFIGREGIFEPLWVIEEGKYAGQWAMHVPTDWGSLIDWGFWVPSEDLEIIEEVPHPALSNSSGPADKLDR